MLTNSSKSTKKAKIGIVGYLEPGEKKPAVWQKKTVNKRKDKSKVNAKPVYGIYATKINEKQSNNEKNKNKRLPLYLKTKNEFINYNKLKTFLTTTFLISSQMHLGEKLCIQTQNLSVLRNYLTGTRKNHAVYNIYYLVSNLRIMFYQLSQRFFYKRSAIVNYVTDSKLDTKEFNLKQIHKFPKRKLVVTWKKWLGGVLTNFKLIAKRLLTRKRNKSSSKNLTKYSVSYPRNIPKLPSMLVSTGNCHWSLNESRLLRINSVQVVNTNYLGAFGDINIGINLNYYPLLSFTTFLTECASTVEHYNRMWHKNRILLRLRKRSLAKMISLSFVKQKELLKAQRTQVKLNSFSAKNKINFHAKVKVPAKTNKPLVHLPKTPTLPTQQLQKIVKNNKFMLNLSFGENSNSKRKKEQLNPTIGYKSYYKRLKFLRLSAPQKLTPELKVKMRSFMKFSLVS